MTKINLLGASILALSICLPAAAQAQVLDEIIVTAQKRAQGLQDVPISISAVTGATIENRSIDSLSELSSSVPNFYIQENQIDSSISVRGVTTGNNKGFEQSVGMYFDGISFGRSQLVRTPLVDLERVEVLRGPQPTLFGKNAIAGAVNVVSAKPTDEFEGKLSLSYEFNHEEPQALGVISGPIAENLNGRLTASYRELGGWINNTQLDRLEPQRDELYFRGQLEYDNGGPLNLNFKGEYATFDSYGYAMEALLPQDGYSTVFAGPIAVETNEDNVRASNDVQSLNDMFNAVVTANYDLGEHTLTSITGYVEYDTKEILDVDYTGLDILDGTNQSEKYNQFSQELRIASPGGETFDYIGGVFYQNNNADVTDQVFLGQFLALAGPPVSFLVDSFWDREFEQSSDLYSVFAQGDYRITDQLTLTAGARLSHEEKTGARTLVIDALPSNAAPQATLEALWAAVLNVGPHQVPTAGLNGSQFDGKIKETNFDPLVRLQYEASDNVSLYASYTQGSKAGGFDIRSNSIPGTPGIGNPGTFEFDGESATNYELGAKMGWDQVRLNVSAFQTDYDDLQTNIFDGVLGFLVQNASAAKVKGIEADGRFLVNDNLQFYASAAILDYKFTSFTDSQCAYQETPTNGTFCDRSGATAPFAPDFTSNFGLDYNRDISENLEFDLNINVDTSSSYFLTTNLDGNLIEDGFTKLGGQIGISGGENTWRLSLIGDNLTNERIRVLGGTLPLARTFVQLASGGALDGTGYNAIYARPRNITLKLDYNF
ncbi:TonB-dependent receptor [Litorimonas cladophorae]|uniref:TonB-dependent receptor n=1 Tax=Litorimonas cladophorae TaxID=1220491 RepID=A0A918KQ93_9PROT|nr:TonB-dependent receptor [Litorimonas cladophorae]GGX70269.1 TonB-dependent receptor [Litorimonas cladophorae]